jgi:hypothetical protein
MKYNFYPQVKVLVFVPVLSPTNSNLISVADLDLSRNFVFVFKLIPVPIWKALSSVSDPDPRWIRIQWAPGSGSRRGKISHNKEEKLSMKIRNFF